MHVAQLPSLSALRVLDSVSRLGSFAAAASELNMTQSAISYQIRNLESIWGVKLFDRTRRGVVLTEDGAVVRDLAQTTLQNISQTYGKVHHETEDAPIRICVPPSLAAMWLVPRFSKFLTTNPGPEVVLHTAYPSQTERDEEFDLELSFLPARKIREDQREVLTDICFPVASAEFLSGQPRPLDSPESLCSVALLERTLPNPGAVTWQSWFEHLKVDADLVEQSVGRGIRFGNSNMQITAAEAGMGVALSRGLLVLDRLKRGTLKRVGYAWMPFPNQLCASLKTQAAPGVETLFEWILEEARDSARELFEFAQS